MTVILPKKTETIVTAVTIKMPRRVFILFVWIYKENYLPLINFHGRVENYQV